MKTAQIRLSSAPGTFSVAYSRVLDLLAPKVSEELLHNALLAVARFRGWSQVVLGSVHSTALTCPTTCGPTANMAREVAGILRISSSISTREGSGSFPQHAHLLTRRTSNAHAFKDVRNEQAAQGNHTYS